jgi:hypothetical protein
MKDIKPARIIATLERDNGGAKNSSLVISDGTMASRGRTRKTWIVVGGLGLLLIAVEIFAAPSGPVMGIGSAVGLMAVIVAIIKYRASTPHLRKFYED